MPYKMSIGKRGEEIAAEYLKENECEIIAHNARVGHDEIDIIACDGECIIFVEVKARAQTSLNRRYGRPASAVDFQKQQKLIRAAEGWLKANPKPGKRVRIDVIEVYLPPIHDDTPIDIGSLKATKIVHMKNAVMKH